LKLTRNTKEKIAAAVLILAALLLLAVGGTRQHKVFDPATEEFGIIAFERISEGAFIVDTTFGGVRLDQDKLYTTYDRSQARGKQACPT
jgi:hypothetical protein